MRNGEVVIIDEFTGRMMPGRRYSEGLHQALEAKEHQPIQPENQTLASITFQNYFRMYEKLAGMTGTALTEADEFLDIYNLEVLEVPTNMPLARARRGRRGLSHQRREIPRRSSRCSRSARSRASRCWSAPRRSRSPSSSPRCCARRAGSSTTSPTRTRSRRSTPATKGAKKTKVFAVLNARYHEQEAYIVCAGRRAGRDHHRDQHGGPRHRHPARRQCRHAHPPGTRRRRGLRRRACAIRAPTRSARRSRG